MNKLLAIELISSAVSMDKNIGQLLDLADKIEEHSVRNSMKKSITDIMGILAVEIIFEIEKIYPDLNPDIRQ
jgi:nitrate reductase NapAB chaperone NapD